MKKIQALLDEVEDMLPSKSIVPQFTEQDLIECNVSIALYAIEDLTR